MRYMITLYQRRDKKWGWRATATNGQVVATDGSQGYENPFDAENLVRQLFQDGILQSKVLIEPRKPLKDRLFKS